MLSIFDIFKIGIGPSSSHTVGPMRIGVRFLEDARAVGAIKEGGRIKISLRGSLALTGVGHGTDRATLLGLLGFEPDATDPDEADRAIATLRETRMLNAGGVALHFDPTKDLDFHGEIIPTIHPNEMKLSILRPDGGEQFSQIYYSVGGGFIATEKQLSSTTEDDRISLPRSSPYEFGSARALLEYCAAEDLQIHDIVLANEDAKRPRAQTQELMRGIWEAMSNCIDRGLTIEGELPGGLEVERRAPAFFRKLCETPLANEREQLFDWLNVYAMAVNEENAAGGRVVTAPTNGAAGIIPAVIKHYCDESENRDAQISVFLATAAGIGMLYKQRASISGAEMGCQGEVGVACSMAAAGLAAVWGATPAQVERAAEIGMEHNLGLTCDPVKGLVQIPCIERNAIGAVKAVNAARLAMRAAENPKVSLDQVIETMRQTGLDMSRKYKETSEGGLAVNVVEC